MHMTARSRSLLFAGVAVLLVTCGSASAQGTLSWNGFAYARGAVGAEGPFDQDEAAAQIHIGIDWNPSVFFGVHVHLLARTDDGGSKHEHLHDGTDHQGSKKGKAGVVEAFLEGNAFTSAGRFRARGGAMFLPTSLENVDSLWENPYAISSSALNTWFGEELRPIGLDLTWLYRGAMLGATVFRGNDTLGALPPVRGWQLHDRWTLLGERIPVDDVYWTSVSVENDGRWGWSARTGWSGSRLSIQYTHFDNRSDGVEYDELYNWRTKFDIVALGWTRGDWTIAAESGWGPTFIVLDNGRRVTSDIRATYLLVSRRIDDWRLTARIDSWDDGDYAEESLTVACIWSPQGRFSVAAEVAATDEETRGQFRLRYGFGSR
jgi:hypothetical protein